MSVERGDSDGGGSGSVQRGGQHVAAAAGRVPGVRAHYSAARRAILRALSRLSPQHARRRPARSFRPASRPLGLLPRLQNLRLRGRRGSLPGDFSRAPSLLGHAELDRKTTRAPEDSGALERTDIGGSVRCRRRDEAAACVCNLAVPMPARSVLEASVTCRDPGG